jgi:hypothetical protein
MRLGRIRIVCVCVAAGMERAPGTMLTVDDVLAARGEPYCVTVFEAVGLMLCGDAIRPEDERPVGYMTRMAYG